MGIMQDKVALVTGAGDGLGRASARAFAREGARVVVSDIDEVGGSQTVALIRESGGEATFVPCDVTSVEQVDALVRKTIDLYGRLDCAHNNAGGGGGMGRPMTHQYRVEDWLHVVEINLNSIWYCMRREIPIMLEQGAGAIVNTSSIYGIAGAVGTAAYVAAKHGVVGLTRAAALEYADQGSPRQRCLSRPRPHHLRPETNGRRPGPRALGNRPVSLWPHGPTRRDRRDRRLALLRRRILRHRPRHAR